MGTRQARSDLPDDIEKIIRPTSSPAPRWGARSGPHERTPPPSSLDQDGLVVLEVFLHALLIGKRHRSPLCPTFDKLVMHQVFAHELDMQTRILHAPDLTGFEGL